MAQGKELTIETVEAIRLAYLEHGGKIRETARALGVSTGAVRKYGPAPEDDLTQLRTDKAAEIIDLLSEVRLAYLRHLLKPYTLNPTSAKDAATVVGILTDKHQLLTGEATERHEHRDLDAARAALAGRLDELAERRRAKGDHRLADGAASG